jgi:hypothetical protein
MEPAADLAQLALVLVKERGETDRDKVLQRTGGQKLGQGRAPRLGLGNGIVERIEAEELSPGLSGQRFELVALERRCSAR